MSQHQKAVEAAVRAWYAPEVASGNIVDVHSPHMRRAIAAFLRVWADKLDGYGNPYIPDYARKAAADLEKSA